MITIHYNTELPQQEGPKETFAFEIRVAADQPDRAGSADGDGAPPPVQRSYFARVDSVPPPRPPPVAVPLSSPPLHNGNCAPQW